jgi:RimJ/RimL family protein N-acetyltransferase
MRIDLYDGFYLSPIIEGDQTAYVEHFRDRETTERLLLIPYPYTKEDADRWVHSRVASSPMQFALRRPDCFLIGGIGLAPGMTAGQVDLGYWVARDYRRQGLAGAAIKAVVDLAFRDLGFKKIQAWVTPDNLSSQRLLEKAGFRHERALAKQIKDGIACDVLIYGLTSPV